MPISLIGGDLLTSSQSPGYASLHPGLDSIALSELGIQYSTLQKSKITLGFAASSGQNMNSLRWSEAEPGVWKITRQKPAEQRAHIGDL